MALPLLAGLASLVPGVISGIVGKRQHDKYADMLSGLEMRVPSSVADAERIYGTLAESGLPGYEVKREQAREVLPSSLNAYKDIVDNPAALMQAMQTSEQNVNKQLTELAISDAVAKAQNLSNLAQFKGTTKAGWEGKVQDFNIQKEMAVGQEEMLGVKELLQGITGGISGGISGAMAGLNLQGQLDLNKVLQQAYAGMGGGAAGAGLPLEVGAELIPSLSELIAMAGSWAPSAKSFSSPITSGSSKGR